ncbi:MAG: GDYXXLXY domain-containing protein, partial [Gammaproteobacteria bacterium]|nr:GDYXXLXY domain-containing protein [Gammaproteobacteria bacterium]
DGTITVKLDEKSIGKFIQLTNMQPLGKDERLIKFRIRDGRVIFATNAYFFQEGTAQYYAGARYGEFRVSPSGDLLLKSLRDKDLKPMGPLTAG